MSYVSINIPKQFYSNMMPKGFFYVVVGRVKTHMNILLHDLKMNDDHLKAINSIDEAKVKMEYQFKDDALNSKENTNYEMRLNGEIALLNTYMRCHEGRKHMKEASIALFKDIINSCTIACKSIISIFQSLLKINLIVFIF
jgi:hypothetical protein